MTTDLADRGQRTSFLVGATRGVSSFLSPTAGTGNLGCGNGRFARCRSMVDGCLAGAPFDKTAVAAAAGDALNTGKP